MAEPIEVCLEQRQGGFRLVNAMPKPGVKNQACIDMLVEETPVELKGIGNRYSMVRAAMLNQCGRLGLTDRRDRGGLCIDLRVVPRSRAQVLGRKWCDIGAHVVRGPVADAGAHGNCLEAVGMGGEKCGDVTALRPAIPTASRQFPWAPASATGPRTT